MSEPRLISPLLDNFIMGDPISDHNGIRCCPAMDTESNDKYIVKIISFPSSQTQLDALLLTNAFENEEAANRYFESRAIELAKEVEFLQSISRQEGFIPYKGFQIVPKEDATGYEVYLLAEYKRSIERHAAKRPFTHLDALNLGLDICSAFSACRRSGYIFVNLKPSNVYVNKNGEYKIGDLGFIKLSSLKYASMPENYISAYTAPEIQDPFASLNDTIDVFSLGAMLYQIYNGGELPDFTEETLPAPRYADEEITSIILKACSISPEDRWTDPAQMGQSLVNYMQKNGASDTPIVPVIEDDISSDPEESTQATEEDQFEPINMSEDPCSITDGLTTESVSVTTDANNQFNSEENTDIPLPPSVLSEEQTDTPQINAITEAPEAETDAVAIEEIPQELVAEVAVSITENDVQVSNSDVTSTDSAEDIASDSFVDGDEEDANSAYSIDESIIASIIAIDSADPESASNDVFDADENESTDTNYDDISDEVSMILAHADELAAMEVPEPVVAPEPTEIIIPTSEESKEAYSSPSAEEYEDPAAGDKDITDIKRLIDDESQNGDVQPQDEYEYFYSAYPPKRRIGKYIVLGVILLSLLIGGFLFYKLYVLQSIHSLTVTGSNDHMTVTIDTKTDNSLLSIVCTDIYGTPVSVPVIDGKASFSGLLPDTEYSIAVEISGLHVLNGDTTASYFTPPKTSIVQHTIVTGNTNGSVILSFTVSGPDSEKWFFTYSAPGVAAETVAFTGHTVTLSNLQDGMIYTGILEPEDDLFIKDKVEISFASSDVIQATNLTVTSCIDNKLTAKWNAPEDAEVDGWTVRCTNGSDYDVTITTEETYVEFTDLDHTNSFTVEVTAIGQSVSQRISVGENTVTVTDFKVDSEAAGKIRLSWNSQVTPQSGWIISYTVNGTPFTKTVAGDQTQTIINPAVPDAEYQFMIQSADAESTVFEPCSYITANAKDFNGYQVTKDNLRFNMCLRPGSGSWDYTDVEVYTNTFSPGALAGFVVHVNRVYGVSYEDVTTAFVIYDESNKIVSIHSSTNAWTYMWYKNYCELNIPAIPQESGNYTIHVYFNGQLANIQSFTVE